MATIQLPSDFKEFLKLLDSNEVEYLLIGGYAVNFHGAPRATGDIDVWIATSSENLQRVAATLVQFGFAGATAALFRNSGAIVRLGMPPLRIEVMTSISGVEFAECFVGVAGTDEFRIVRELRLATDRAGTDRLNSFPERLYSRAAGQLGAG